ncbi:MAG: OmpA family protein [Muribaculaceae bacterium]|nr:OmpA family protein [Muribaculaceae bacterium]MDE6631548.1 OmpA family protein [Muribaculaceae bacterium]
MKICRLLYLLFVFGLFGISASAQENLEDMTFAQMIKSVDLSSEPKAAELIRKFQDLEARQKLMNGPLSPKQGKCSIEAYRKKEVILITIPSSELFAPNSTDLSEGASKYLNPIKRYMKDPDMFRVLLVMHTDNTGSVQYRDNITADRVDAVTEWFENQGADTSFTFSYAFGDEAPLVPNTSIENRDKNRRLEVFLMPGTKMLEAAKQGKIDF